MKFIKFLRLEWGEKTLFFFSLYRVIYFRLLLNRVPFNLLIEKANEKSVKKYQVKDRLPTGRITRAVRRAGGVVPGATCLVQSLAGKVIFAREGYETTLKIGVVRKEGKAIESHAWLLCQNDVVLGRLENLEAFSIIL
jgi:hypothetical protein